MMHSTQIHFARENLIFNSNSAQKNVSLLFVLGRITYLFGQIREELWSCWKNIYPWVNIMFYLVAKATEQLPKS